MDYYDNRISDYKEKVLKSVGCLGISILIALGCILMAYLEINLSMPRGGSIGLIFLSSSLGAVCSLVSLIFFACCWRSWKNSLQDELTEGDVRNKIRKAKGKIKMFLNWEDDETIKQRLSSNIGLLTDLDKLKSKLTDCDLNLSH